jgi:hypothetical protein
MRWTPHPQILPQTVQPTEITTLSAETNPHQVNQKKAVFWCRHIELHILYHSLAKLDEVREQPTASAV